MQLRSNCQVNPISLLIWETRDTKVYPTPSFWRKTKHFLPNMTKKYIWNTILRKKIVSKKVSKGLSEKKTKTYQLSKKQIKQKKMSSLDSLQMSNGVWSPQFWMHITGGGFGVGPYLVDGQQGGWHRWRGGVKLGLVKPESRSAPVLLPAFFKGSEVITTYIFLFGSIITGLWRQVHARIVHWCLVLMNLKFLLHIYMLNRTKDTKTIKTKKKTRKCRKREMSHCSSPRHKQGQTNRGWCKIWSDVLLVVSVVKTESNMGQFLEAAHSQTFKNAALSRFLSILGAAGEASAQKVLVFICDGVFGVKPKKIINFPERPLLRESVCRWSKIFAANTMNWGQHPPRMSPFICAEWWPKISPRKLICFCFLNQGQKITTFLRLM